MYYNMFTKHLVNISSAEVVLKYSGKISEIVKKYLKSILKKYPTDSNIFKTPNN